MAKKKSAPAKAAKPTRKTAAATKKPVAKKSATTKPVARPKASAGKKAPAKKTSATGANIRRTATAKPAAVQRAASLGRPTLTADEPLYLVFKEDYHARQIFEFLRVQTVRELEEHAPDEIFKRLTKPVRESVDRIRRFLAERNRCLSGDEEFALAHKQRMQDQEEGLARSS